VVIFGSGPSGHAGEIHMPGVERKVLKEVESNISGYANIRIRDVIFQPGASTPMMTMENDMVCETTEGHGPSRGSAETCQWPERPVSHLTKSAQEPT
jgi:hypothetical protein